jgi:hypothetical protein
MILNMKMVLNMNDLYVVYGLVMKLDGTRTAWTPVKNQLYTDKEDAERDAKKYNDERDLAFLEDIEYKVSTITEYINFFGMKKKIVE